MPHIGKRCVFNFSLLCEHQQPIHAMQAPVLDTRPDVKCRVSLETVLWRNLLWKAEFGPVEFVLINLFMLTSVLAHVLQAVIVAWCMLSNLLVCTSSVFPKQHEQPAISLLEISMVSNFGLSKLKLSHICCTLQTYI